MAKETAWEKGMRVAMSINGKHCVSIINFVIFKFRPCTSFTHTKKKLQRKLMILIFSSWKREDYGLLSIHMPLWTPSFYTVRQIRSDFNSKVPKSSARDQSQNNVEFRRNALAYLNP